MSARYHQILDYQRGIGLWIDFTTERGRMVDYTVVLLLTTEAAVETIRVYDSAHGFNEMHRYTRSGGKRTGTLFYSGSLSQGMQAALEDVEKRCIEMIEGWDR